jgi:hypothetical protein
MIQGVSKRTVEDDSALVKDKASRAESMQQLIGMGGEQKGASAAHELFESLFCLFIEAAVAGTDALIESQAVMPKPREQGKQQATQNHPDHALHRQGPRRKSTTAAVLRQAPWARDGEKGFARFHAQPGGLRSITQAS